jgi:hypothetical protein
VSATQSGLFDELDRLVAACTQVGVRATYDPRNVNPPCVLFVPPVLDLDVMGGMASAEFQAIVIGPPVGNVDAWRVMDDMARQLVTDDVLPYVSTITPSSYGVDESSANPALVLAWTGTVAWP